MLFYHDDQKLISRDVAHTVLIWDLQTYKIMHRLDSVKSIAVSPDAVTFALVKQDNALIIWKPQQILVYPYGHSNPVSSFHFNHTQSTLTTFNDSDGSGYWHLATGKYVHLSSGSFRAFLSPDGRMAASTSPDEGLRVSDIATGKTLFSRQQGFPMAFSPDNRHLLYCRMCKYYTSGNILTFATTEVDAEIWLADIEKSNEQLFLLITHRDYLYISPDLRTYP
jgi:WD40 repeat protein